MRQDISVSLNFRYQHELAIINLKCLEFGVKHGDLNIHENANEITFLSIIKDLRVKTDDILYGLYFKQIQSKLKKDIFCLLSTLLQIIGKCPQVVILLLLKWVYN